MFKFSKTIFWSVFFLTLFLKADGALAFTLNETKTFKVDSAYDSAGRSEVRATLHQVGDRGLYYIEDGWWNSLSPNDAIVNNQAVLDLLNEFDKTIYSRLVGVYGSEWSPGIDNESRIFVLITPLKKNAGGFFNSLDEIPAAQAASSNEREIIYLNSLYLNSSLEKVFLAHEFQHMINFYQKEKMRSLVEDIWLNEARSEYASTLCGYDNVYDESNLERRVSDFFRDTSDSLTEWQNQAADYGSVDLFMQYLVGRYSEQILIKMMKADTVGIASINQALKEIGSVDTFADIFTNWTIANYANDCLLGEGQKYCYLNKQLTYERFHVNPILSNMLVTEEGTFFSYSDNAKDWSGHWYEFLPFGDSALNFILNFSGNSASNFQVPFLIYSGNGAKSVKFLKFSAGQNASDLVSDFGGQINKIVLIPANQTKISNFSANEPMYSYSYTIKLTSTLSATPSPSSSASPSPQPSATPSLQLVSPNYTDGSLIRATDDYQVFVINGKFKRWLQSPKILFAYPHLGWQSIIEVTPAQRDWYQESWLIRADGDPRVYEINGDLSKHWLNMTAEKFIESGRNWGMVFIVNKTERDLYRTGADVLR